MVNGEQTTKPPEVKQPEKPGWIRHPIKRAKYAYGEHYPLKPATLIEGYPSTEKATKQLESFCKKIEEGIGKMKPEQRVEVMAEIHKILTKYRLDISPENKTALFELMAKMYTKPGTAEAIANSADKKVIQMGRFVFQLAELVAKGEGRGAIERSASDVIQSFVKVPFNHGDAMRFTSIQLNMYNKPFGDGIADLGKSMGLEFNPSEMAGFLHEAKSRGLYFSVAEQGLNDAKNSFMSQLWRLSQGQVPHREKLMRGEFIKAVEDVIKGGQHLTGDETYLAVLKSERFQKAFAETFGGKGNTLREAERRMAITNALNQFIADIEEASKRNISSLRLQMEFVLTGKGELMYNKREVYREAKDELKALYTFVAKVTASKPLEESLGKYATLSREAAAEAEALATAVSRGMEAVRGPIRGPRVDLSFFRRYLLPWAPLVVMDEMVTSLGKAPGLRRAAWKDVHYVKRLAIWSAAYIGGIYLTMYILKKRSESLEKALASRGGPLVPYLSKLDSSEKSFFRSNPNAYRVFSALFWGPMEKLPISEGMLDELFRTPALPVINSDKIKEFAGVFRKWWAESQGKGYSYEDIMRLLEPKLVEWADPAIKYLKPGSGTKGGSMIFWFSQYYKLKPEQQRFLESNPEMYKMIVIGLGEGTIAASHVPELISGFLMNPGAVSTIRLAMDDRRRKKKPGSIRDPLMDAMGRPDVITGRGRGMVYLGQVSEGSIVRFAELAATPSEKDKRRLEELAALYNAGAAGRLNRFVIMPGQAVYGDPIDVALKVARGEIPSLDDAKKKGYVSLDLYARLGIKKPETVAYILGRGPVLIDWLKAKEKNIGNGQLLFDEFAVTQKALTGKMDTKALIKHIEDQLKMDSALRTKISWSQTGFKKAKPVEPGAGVIPLRALIPGAAPIEAPVKPGKAKAAKPKERPKRRPRPPRAATRRKAEEEGI